MKSDKKMKFDIIFLSYDEPNAEENWRHLKKLFPYAQRVHGVKGILKAHKKCESIARTDKFYVVDGDQYILENFDLNSAPVEFKDCCYYMWMSRNSINDLEYPNGGVKFFPKGIFDGIQEYGVDLFVNLPHKLINQVASLNKFNASPFYSWRAGFRECVQLASRHSDVIKHRTEVYLLNVWCNKGSNRPFGKWCVKGARAGRRYGLENRGNAEAVELMNNYDWLRERFYYELKEGYLRGMANLDRKFKI
jgi:hypothetical protein